MNRLLVLALLPMAALLFIWGCDNDTSNKISDPGGGGGPEPTDKTCLSCHSSEDALKEALDGKVSGSKVLVPNKGDG